MKVVQQGTSSTYSIGTPPRELWPLIAARTDANGAVNLPSVSQGRVFRIRIESTKYGVQSLAVHRGPAGEWLSAQQTVPVGQLSGRVVAVDGARVDGIKIRVHFKNEGRFSDRGLQRTVPHKR